MDKCFITKLKGASGNSDLLRIGEMRLHFDKSTVPTTSNRGKNLNFTKNSQLELIGDAYFTDETLSTNLGKKITVTKDFPKSVYVSNADCDVCILDKYSLSIINDWVKNTTNDNGNFHFDLDGLKYSKSLSKLIVPKSKVSGDIENLKNLTDLTDITLNSSDVSGDIENLKNLTDLTTLNMSSTQVSGDISALKNLTALTNLRFGYDNIHGSISSLQKLTALTALILNDTNVSGNISSLKNFTALTTFTVDNISGDISNLKGLNNLSDIKIANATLNGDLATLPPNVVFISLNKGTITFTWGERPSSSKIVAMEGNVVISNIDTMLQNQAQCQAAITSSSNTWEKTISCIGTRSSASDAAVQTLQSKGYTVSVTPAL